MYFFNKYHRQGRDGKLIFELIRAKNYVPQTELQLICFLLIKLIATLAY